MTARLLEGRPVADRLRSDASARLHRLVPAGGTAPRLVVLADPDDGAAAVYARSVTRAATAVGLDAETIPVTRRDPERNVIARIHALNTDPAVAGIVVAEPLPPQLAIDAIVAQIDPARDVDGAGPVNAGMLARGAGGIAPATARAVMALLDFYEIPVAGRRAVVVGRSAVIGRPVAALLLAADATVTVCHSRTVELAAETGRAEVLVVAAGSPGLVGPEMVASGAVVVDCGITTVGGSVVGDVAPSVREVAAAVTPVPGGVGPVTSAVLAFQAVEAAEAIAARS